MKITTIVAVEDPKESIGFVFKGGQLIALQDLHRRFMHLAIDALPAPQYRSLVNLIDRVNARRQPLKQKKPASEGNDDKENESVIVFTVFPDELMELYDCAFQVIMSASDRIADMKMDQEIEEHFTDCL